MSKLYLAPMEGVTDFVMRDTLTSIGGIDQCTTEFLRVTQNLHPHSVFLRFCPELRNLDKLKGKTRFGVPVFMQLLGGQPGPLAENATRAVELGALGIDLNFGCPAKTVNRHDGGASLLKCSTRLHDIVRTVRLAVPQEIPVTVKIRLGFDDPRQCLENTKAIEEAGANLLTVHCRTKTDGYKPPAYWKWIPLIKENVKIPIVANGEIWTVSDFAQCKKVTECQHFMIGRGALRNPFIFAEIKNLFQNSRERFNNEHLSLVPSFFNSCEKAINDHFATARTKQWLSQLRFSSDHGRDLFDCLKIIKKPKEFKEKLFELIPQ